jgi:hypothetical protein
MASQAYSVCAACSMVCVCQLRQCYYASVRGRSDMMHAIHQSFATRAHAGILPYTALALCTRLRQELFSSSAPARKPPICFLCYFPYFPQVGCRGCSTLSLLLVRRSGCWSAGSMAPKKERAEKENVSLGPSAREGENVFGVCHIFASFNDSERLCPSLRCTQQKVPHLTRQRCSWESTWQGALGTWL